jgi:hypothetical protein
VNWFKKALKPVAKQYTEDARCLTHLQNTSAQQADIYIFLKSEKKFG